MKKLLLSIITTVALLTTSCQQLQSFYHAFSTATSYQTSTATADQILVRSEQLTKQALYTFDTFLFIERNNESQLKALNPQIHVVAEKIRAHGKEWLKSARRTTKAFKENRTAQSEADMRTAYATLLQAYNEVKTAKAQADTLTTKTP